MTTSLKLLAVTLLSGTIAFSQTQRAWTAAEIQAANKEDAFPQYFPETFDPFERQWYHRQLAAANQPSLYELRNTNRRIYRLDWIPSFHHSIFAVVEVGDHGEGTLELTQLTGAGGYKAGQVDKTRDITLSPEQVAQFKAAVAKLDFWNLPDGATKAITGTDGSEWVFEGIEGGKYHVVEEWTPEKGPLHELGVLVVKTFGGWNGKDVLSY